MTIQEIIKKSIEGGWKPEIVEDYKNFACNHTKPIEQCVTIPHEKIFLDPKFWQCLGKTLGWKMIWICPADGKIEPREVTYEEFCDNCERKVTTQDGWLYYQHRFIDHLAEKKSAKEFFKDL